MLLFIVGVGFLILSLAVFAWFLYRSGKRETAQDISDRQDLVWREQRRN